MQDEPNTPAVGRVDTHEIVINWADGLNVRVEMVPIAALQRPTREFTVPEMLGHLVECVRT